MKSSVFSLLLFISIFGVLNFSCKEKKPRFTVHGIIQNADSNILYLEKRSLAETFVIDSVRLDKKGSYIFKEDVADFPEFYSLRLNNQLINFAIDSSENLTINASASTFNKDYSIEGSESSSKIKVITLNRDRLSDSLNALKTKLDSKLIDQNTYADQLSLAVDNYKKATEDIILADTKSMAAYYGLFQQVNDLLIFNPYNKKDLRIFQAVATNWKYSRAEAERTKQLETFTLTALAELYNAEKKDKMFDSLKNKNIRKKPSELYDISLPDIHNQNRTLHSLYGKVIILDFTVYQSQNSPARNIQINSVYEKYKGKLEVYQVSFDDDAHIWKNVAVNLPWICVRESRSTQSDLIPRFNIQSLPTTYLLKNDGEIVKRLSPSDNLEAEVKKIL